MSPLFLNNITYFLAPLTLLSGACVPLNLVQPRPVLARPTLRCAHIPGAEQVSGGVKPGAADRGGGGTVQRERCRSGDRRYSTTGARLRAQVPTAP